MNGLQTERLTLKGSLGVWPAQHINVQNINSDQAAMVRCPESAHPPSLHSNPSFGNAATLLLEKPSFETKILDYTADKLYAACRFLNLGRIDYTKANLSMEDWASRALTLGLYAPQTLFAFLDDKHKYETLGRNAVVWTLTLLLAVWTKHPTAGINSLFSKPWFPWRIDPTEYAKILKHANIPQKTSWARLDKNDLDTIVLRTLEAMKSKADYPPVLEEFQRLLVESNQLVETSQQATKLEPLLSFIQANEASLKADLKALANTAKAKLAGFFSEGAFDELNPSAWTPEMKHSLSNALAQTYRTAEEKAMVGGIYGVIKKLISFKVLASVVNILLTTAVIGWGAMELVFWFIAPLDHDFDKTKLTPLQTFLKNIKAVKPKQILPKDTFKQTTSYTDMPYHSAHPESNARFSRQVIPTTFKTVFQGQISSAQRKRVREW